MSGGSPPDAGIDADAKATWKQRQKELAFEPAARWAMQFAVLAALGPVAAWCFVLLGGSGGDIRGSPVFWLLALVFGIWGAPVQTYARWTMLSLRYFIALWPALVAAAWAYDAGSAEAVEPLWMGVILAGTIALAAAAWAAIRRSSLPGGRTRAVLHEPGYRPPTALMDVDPQLRSAQIWFTFPLISNILSLSISGAVALTGESPSPEAVGSVMWPMIGACTAEVGLLAWGQYQGRRTPGRKPRAWIGLVLVQVLLPAGLSLTLIALGAARNRSGVMAAGLLIGLGGAVTACCAAMAWRRMGERASYYRGR